MEKCILFQRFVLGVDVVFPERNYYVFCVIGIDMPGTASRTTYASFHWPQNHDCEMKKIIINKNRWEGIWKKRRSRKMHRKNKQKRAAFSHRIDHHYVIERERKRARASKPNLFRSFIPTINRFGIYGYFFRLPPHTHSADAQRKTHQSNIIIFTFQVILFIP